MAGLLQAAKAVRHMGPSDRRHHPQSISGRQLWMNTTVWCAQAFQRDNVCSLPPPFFFYKLETAVAADSLKAAQEPLELSRMNHSHPRRGAWLGRQACSEASVGCRGRLCDRVITQLFTALNADTSLDPHNKGNPARHKRSVKLVPAFQNLVI